jgi:hypothetical protein
VLLFDVVPAQQPSAEAIVSGVVFLEVLLPMESYNEFIGYDYAMAGYLDLIFMTFLRYLY